MWKDDYIITIHKKFFKKFKKRVEFLFMIGAPAPAKKAAEPEEVKEGE